MKIDQAKMDKDLLNVLADLLTLPLPQQAMVWSDFIGLAAGAMMAQMGWTKLQAQRWALDRMKDKLEENRPH